VNVVVVAVGVVVVEFVGFHDLITTLPELGAAVI
jgi:hypothetical protein